MSIPAYTMSSTANTKTVKHTIVRKTMKKKNSTPEIPAPEPDALFSEEEEHFTTDERGSDEVSDGDSPYPPHFYDEPELSDEVSEEDEEVEPPTKIVQHWTYPEGKGRDKVDKENKQLKALGATNEEVNDMLVRVNTNKLLDSRALLVHQAYTTDTREDKSSRSAKSAFNITLKCSPIMLDTIQQHFLDSDGEEYHAESVKEALKHYFYRKWDILLSMEAIGAYKYRTDKKGQNIPEFLDTDTFNYDVPSEFLGGWFKTTEATAIMDTQQLLHKNSREAKRKAKGKETRAQVKKDILGSLTKEEIAELFKASNQ